MANYQGTFRIINVYDAILGGFTFNPTAHINYRSAMLLVLDGLPKYLNFGGSGELMEE